MTDEKYIPALSYYLLTPIYDPVVRLTTRERLFKKALVSQCGIKPGQRALDIACGTGTLAILLKQSSPTAEICAIDGDQQILKIAKNKARRAGIAIQFDHGLSNDLPYTDASFDCVVSSLFFHHLFRKDKLKTLLEVKRILKPLGEFHVADWGLAANSLMKVLSRSIQLLDGFETTADSFDGLLPELMTESGFAAVEETNSFNTLFGTIRLHASRRPQLRTL